MELAQGQHEWERGELVKALISGNLGFVGRHFQKALEARGYEVKGLDVKAAPSQDCLTYFQSTEALRMDTHFDLVVHAAAVVKGRATIDRSPLATAVNLALDAAMFRWASIVRPGRVIYFSSSAVYPVQYQTGMTRTLAETDFDQGKAWIGQPDQVYGWSKAVGEVLAHRLMELEIPVTVVRPFSGYGEDQDADYPFPSFIQRARDRQDPFELWCGPCIRDFIHVDDVVAGTLAAMDSDVQGPLNLCTGRAVSFDELAELVTMAAGYRPGFRHVIDAPSGPAYRVGDVGRLLRVYDPQISLEEGILRALDA
jgi:nucleoside-diphosphate-sugar epimerase